MNINSTLNIPEASEPKKSDDQDLDDLLFDNKSSGDSDSSSEKKEPIQSKDELIERLDDLKDRVETKASKSSFDESILDKLEELEREASRIGIRQISGTISHLKVKAENIFSETESMLESDTLQNLNEKKLSKTDLKEVQKTLNDIEESYEERMENLWKEVEDLEFELNETNVAGGFGSENFSDSTPKMGI